MTPPVRAIVALGSNLGARRAHLDAAVAALAAEPGVTILAASDWIETDAVGGPPGQGPYLNGVVELETTLTARELLTRLLAIESEHDRDRSAGHWAPRTLDLDLILHGDEVIEEPDLVVPHPRSERRAFVLQPMAQLDPGRRFPNSGRTVQECLRALWP